MTKYEQFYNQSVEVYKPYNFSKLTSYEEYSRDAGIKKYGFAILSDSAIKKISKYAPILEVGAGTGYWAYEFQKRNIDYIATEPYISNNRYFYFGEGDSKQWVECENLTAIDAIKKYPDRNVLFCWPNYGNPWAYEALITCKSKYIIYCGEGDNGCTADDKFHEYLDLKYKLIKEIQIPKWRGINDKVFVYKLRRRINERSKSDITTRRIRSNNIYTSVSRTNSDYIHIRKT